MVKTYGLIIYLLERRSVEIKGRLAGPGYSSPEAVRRAAGHQDGYGAHAEALPRARSGCCHHHQHPAAAHRRSRTQSTQPCPALPGCSAAAAGPTLRAGMPAAKLGELGTGCASDEASQQTVLRWSGMHGETVLRWSGMHARPVYRGGTRRLDLLQRVKPIFKIGRFESTY
eukprot:SAG22_NODE_585_length_8867_cov_11.509580_3_plen_171_part_00